MRKLIVRTRPNLLALIAFVAVLPVHQQSAALPAAGEPATALEIALLPQYCIGTYQPAKAKTPQENIVNCGGYMNHFCGALVLIKRVGEAGRNKWDKQWLASHARTELNYTLQHMTPNCPIAAEVRAADTRLRIHEQVVK